MSLFFPSLSKKWMFHVKHEPTLPADPDTWIEPSRLPLLDAYASALGDWNRRVNLVARGSVTELRWRHIPHCLSLAARRFPDGAVVVDWGTGGGLPAIPLAIAFPGIQVVAVDGTAKKTAALKAMVRNLGLENVEVWNGRAEVWDGQAHYFVSRAAAPLRKLWQWSKRAGAGSATMPDSELSEAGGSPATDARTIWEPGLICLKGGDLAKEIRQVKRVDVEQWPLDTILRGDGYEDKYIVHVKPRLEP
ncbi:MAG: 16S rRNA (guanine527-N7)-methyltransferase [Rhodothermales bacterium]|jgi:16S rRNA (guanine527-N7)-methyltransferase